ncbi:MAG: hypothetical protein GC131_04810 [Alphaproteobacteria bacterium]|nr:hypothetical protein [Alphaproteobacteria bacterium]
MPAGGLTHPTSRAFRIKAQSDYGMIGKLTSLLFGGGNKAPAKPAAKQSAAKKPAAKQNNQSEIQKRLAQRRAEMRAQGGTAPAPSTTAWQADRVSIVQQLWGNDWHLPEGKNLAVTLTRPFALDREMNVLDLHAGFGGTGRLISAEFKGYSDGLEPDEKLAEAGMEISRMMGMRNYAPVSVYNPNEFTPTKLSYDCVVMRELFFALPDKQAFAQALRDSMKPRGQLSWTDYVVEDSIRERPAVADWLARDPQKPQPLSYDGLQNFWAKAGFDVRVNDDRTREYMKTIKKSLAYFLRFVTKKKEIEMETKKLIVAEVDMWATRYMAFEKGMKFYRFYAMRK